MRQRQGTSEPLVVKRPSPEQIWACLQRYLTFEDPESRWERMVALTLRQIKARKLRTRELERLPLAELERLFTEVYGTQSQDPPTGSITRATMLNVVLSTRDLERFNAIGFDSWLLTNTQDDSDAPVEPAVAMAIANHMALSPGQKEWIAHSARTVPDWEMLKKEGPWHSDARARLVNEMLMRMPARYSSDLYAGFMDASKLFDELVKKYRKELPGSFLPKLVVIVEGDTEAVLLPHCAVLTGVRLQEKSIYIIPAGGSKQVARRYLELRDVSAVPIVVIVDADATDQIELVSESLRDSDYLHVWAQGELEDTFPAQQLVQLVNQHLRDLGVSQFTTLTDFPSDERRTDSLDRIWRRFGLGSFDKIGFANSLVEQLTSPSQVPPDIVSLFKTMNQKI